MAKMGYEGRTVHFEWRNKPQEAFGYKFKSQAERKWAQYLEFLLKSGAIDKWEYEPQTFEFNERYRKRGIYTPDFLVTESVPAVTIGRRSSRGRVSTHCWHEVKTSLRQKDVYRFKQMHRDFPNEIMVLVLTSEPKYKTRQKILVDNALRYVSRVMYAGSILRKWGIT